MDRGTSWSRQSFYSQSGRDRKYKFFISKKIPVSFKRKWIANFLHNSLLEPHSCDRMGQVLWYENVSLHFSGLYRTSLLHFHAPNFTWFCGLKKNPLHKCQYIGSEFLQWKHILLENCMSWHMSRLGTTCQRKQPFVIKDIQNHKWSQPVHIRTWPHMFSKTPDFWIMIVLYKWTWI